MAKKNDIYKTKKSVQLPNNEIYKIIPILLIIGLVPLILYLKPVNLRNIELLYAGKPESRVDIFSYYKMVSLLLFTAAGILVYLVTRRDNPLSIHKKPYYIPMVVFTLLVLLSSVASEHKDIAFFGFMERYEGALVLAAYMAILFLSMNIVINEKTIRGILLIMSCSAFLILLIGALQFFGYDLLKTDFVGSLIVPPSLSNDGGSFTSNFGPNAVFSTLYNPNYMGSYTAILVPVIILSFLWIKKIPYKLAMGGLLCLALINWVGCDSRAGLFGGLFSFAIIVIMLRKKVWKHKKIFLTAIIISLVGLIVINTATNGNVVNRIARMTSLESKEEVTENRKALDKAITGLSDISMNNEKMMVKTDQGTLQIIMTGGELITQDENNKNLVFSFNNGIATFSDERFVNIKLNIKAADGLVEVYYNEYHLIDIVLTEKGLKSSSNMWMNYRGDDETVEVVKLPLKESFGSNRGYIWSRTLPLLKKAVLLGYGPDTFPIYFPQYDYIGKLRNYEVGGIFVDKPHNMYLQTAVNTGVISLLALLAIFGMYFVSSIKIYFKEEFKTFFPVAGLACFAAFCGYAVAGLFNDSVVSVAPVFWTLLGLGIGINVMLMEKTNTGNKTVLKNKAQKTI